MSMQHTACVLHKFTDFNASDTLVMLVLADAADNELGQCWPSVRHIGRLARLSRRTVQYALGRLEEAGYINTTLRNGSSLYTLLFDPWTGALMSHDEWLALKKASKQAESSASGADDAPPRARAAPQGATDAPPRATDAHMNQSLNQSLKQKNARAREADPEGASRTRAQEKSPHREDIYGKYTGAPTAMPDHLEALNKLRKRRRAPDAEAGTAESA